MYCRYFVNRLCVQHLPAVNDQSVARDEGCFVGHKEQDAVSNFFGLSHAQEGFIATRQPRALFFGGVFIDGPARRKSTKARRIDGTGTNAVYSNAVLPIV